jgi:hypothetical protein
LLKRAQWIGFISRQVGIEQTLEQQCSRAIPALFVG